MKRATLTILCLLVGSTVWAGMAPSILPASSHYQGRNSFFVNDGGAFLVGHLEFAVYDTQQQSLAGYARSERYVYAYQIFSYASSTASINSFSLLGGSFTNAALDAGDTLDGVTTTGISSTGSGVTDAGAAAVWNFNSGTLIQGTNSWFLVFYSDTDWVKGDYAVKSTYNDDIPVNIPEPITLAMMAIGAGLSIMRKRQ
jgi:hypothetical protein